MGPIARRLMFDRFLGGSNPKEPTFIPLGGNRYRLNNADTFRLQMMRDIHATGRPEEMWDTFPYRLESREKLRDKAQENWVRSDGPGATVYMDSAEVQKRTGIDRRYPGNYKAMGLILLNRDLIPDGFHTFESLANNQLKGVIKIVGEKDRSDLAIANNDTAKIGSLYSRLGRNLHRPNKRSYMGTIGSYRSYLPANSTIYKKGDAIYVRAYQKLALDNFDYESNNPIAGFYNNIFREAGKAVNIDYDGQGVLREFYIDPQSDVVMDLAPNRDWRGAKGDVIARGREFAEIRERVEQGI